MIVVGTGNEFLGDDGIGPRVVKNLEEFHRIPGVVYETMGVGGLEILETIKGFGKAVFIDALLDKKGKPGTVHHFTPGSFRETLHLSSQHDLNFNTAISLGKSSGLEIPAIIEIFAVQISSWGEFDKNLSPELQSKFYLICRQLSGHLRRIAKERASINRKIKKPI